MIQKAATNSDFAKKCRKPISAPSVKSAPYFINQNQKRKKMNNIPYGYCHCGCGQKTKMAIRTSRTIGHIEGEPIKYIRGHCHKKPNPNSKRRRTVYKPNHPKAICNSVRRYIVVAEKALGKNLPKNTVVHHVSGDPTNDSNNNLVICENQKYHLLLHSREKALKECGHANWRKCWICQKYDDPKNLYVAKRGNPVMHLKCQREYEKERARLKKQSGENQ